MHTNQIVIEDLGSASIKKLLMALFSIYETIHKVDSLLLMPYKRQISVEHSFKINSSLKNISINTKICAKDKQSEYLAEQANILLSQGKDSIFKSINHFSNKEDFANLCGEVTQLGNDLIEKNSKLFSTYSVDKFALAKTISQYSSISNNNSSAKISLIFNRDKVPVKPPSKLNIETLLGEIEQDKTIRGGIFKIKMVDFENDKQIECRLNGNLIKCIILDKNWQSKLIGSKTPLRFGDALRAEFSFHKTHEKSGDRYYLHKILDHRNYVEMVQEDFDFESELHDNQAAINQ